MSLGQRSMPILPVRDVLASADFFAGLGFQTAGHWKDDDGTVSFAIIIMDTITIGLSRDIESTGSGDTWCAYLYLSDIDAFADLAETSGIKVARPMVDQPYDCRDLEILDLDGNRLCFGQDLSPTKAGPGL